MIVRYAKLEVQHSARINTYVYTEYNFELCHCAAVSFVTYVTRWLDGWMDNNNFLQLILMMCSVCLSFTRRRYNLYLFASNGTAILPWQIQIILFGATSTAPLCG